MASARVAKLLPLLALATATWCAAQQAQDQPLQFTIRQTSPNILQAEMHNAGNSPLTFAFGIRMAMDAIRLSIMDAKAETTALTAKHYVTVDPTPTSARGEDWAESRSNRAKAVPSRSISGTTTTK